MPSIMVSDGVLQRIRSLRETAGETDEQVLARVLALAESDREERLRAYEAAEQDTQSTN